MEFNTNSTFLYIIAICVILLYWHNRCFLNRAYRRGKVRMDTAGLKKTIVSTTVFTIAPAVSILIGIVTLSKFLGIPLPWIRMSVIGAITMSFRRRHQRRMHWDFFGGDHYGSEDLYGDCMGDDAGILPSIILPPILMKKIQGGMVKLQSKDSKWEICSLPLCFLNDFRFLGMVFADVRSGIAGWIPVFVLLVSAVIMALCGLLIKKCNMKWLETYALAISMVGAMIFAVVITPMIG